MTGRLPAHALVASILAGALYATGLAISPPHLTHDEIKFALQAQSIAESGRDINGRFLPLYFVEPGFSVGRDPICIYVMAAVLRLRPLSEASIRFSTVIAGAVSVGLFFVLVSLLFKRRSVAWLGALLFALTPTYYIHSRLALSVVYPVPFTILWMIVLLLYLQRPCVRRAVVCGLVLGAGIYSYLAAAIMMPIYLAATVVVLVARGERRPAVAVLLACAAMLVPLALWQQVEAERYENILTAYRLYDPTQLTPAQKLRELVSVASIRARIETWWDAFNPERLFFTGESSLQISTRQIGSFLLPAAVFIVIGVCTVVRKRRDSLAALVLVGLVVAPLPAVLMLDVEIRRWLGVVPFAMLLASFGVATLLDGQRWHRMVCVVLVALAVIQFAVFTRDYFGPYRTRATVWFGGDIRGAVMTVLDDARQQPPATIYVSTAIPWVDAYWRFYATARGQQELLQRTRYVRDDPGELTGAAASDVLLAPAEPVMVPTEWSVRHVISGVDGAPSFRIYKR
jgi:4-amino-4-deoxy-L-arabinose transferase-like glycosyltransferase